MREIRKWIVAAAVFGCGGAWAQAPAPAPASAAAPHVAIKLKLTPEQQARADALAASVRGNAFPSVTAELDPQNGPLFLYLAATSANDGVVAAALSGMSRVYAEKPGKGGRPVVDDDYRAVVKAYLASANPAVLGGALDAARPLLGLQPPDAATLATILDVVQNHKLPQAREHAVRLLNSVHDFQIPKPQPGPIKERVLVAMLDAAQDDVDYVAASALTRLAWAAYPDMPKRDELLAVARKQMARPDKVVHARALELASKLAKAPDEKDAVGKMAEDWLADPDPFVRSIAAEAVGELQRVSALPKLMPLVDDPHENVDHRTGVQDLDGKPLDLFNDGSTGRRVDDAAIHALARLTRGLGARAFKPGTIRANQLGTDLPDAAKRAYAWYEKTGKTLAPAK